MKKQLQYSADVRRLFGRIRSALLDRQIFGCEIEPDKKCRFLFRVVRQRDGVCLAGPGTLDKLLHDVQML